MNNSFVRIIIFSISFFAFSLNCYSQTKDTGYYKATLVKPELVAPISIPTKNNDSTKFIIVVSKDSINARLNNKWTPLKDTVELDAFVKANLNAIRTSETIMVLKPWTPYINAKSVINVIKKNKIKKWDLDASNSKVYH